MASASAEFESTGTFSGPGSGDGQIEAPGRAAVEQSTGNLFVVDSGNDRVQVFKPNGSGTADYLTQFGGGALSTPWGIAIDENAGQTYVYVADAGNDRILKYSSDEAATPSFSVDGSFTSPAKGSAAAAIGDFKAALAIDRSTHELLVADPGNDEVKRFSPAGALQGTPFDGSAGAGSPGAFTGLLDIAVDSSGDVYVIDANGPNIAFREGTSRALRYSSAGAYESELLPVGSEQRPATVAVSPGDDSVAVSGQQGGVNDFQPLTLHLFDSSGAQTVTTTLLGLNSATGLSFGPGVRPSLYLVMDRATDRFSSSFGTPQIERFADVFRPVITIDPVAESTITRTEAEFTGTVNPNGFATEWHFEYSGDGGGSWTSTPSQNAGAGAAPVAVSAAVSGLQVETSYQVRLVASNSEGSRTSEPRYFSTDPAVKAVKAATATNFTETSVTLNGTIAPGGVALTECKFEYGTTFSYGNSVPCAESPGSIGSGEDPVPVHADVAGLSTGRLMFRLVAVNALGSNSGSGVTYIPIPPSVLGQSVNASSSKALLNARIDPGLGATSFHFEYGATSSYGQSTPGGSIAADSGPSGVDEEIAGLAPSTLYHYRVVVTNPVGQDQSPDMTFVTDAEPDAEACPNAPVRNAQGATYLANCRAYEQVSQVQKYGYPVGSQLDPIPLFGIDDSGERGTWYSSYPLDGAKAGSKGGWLSQRDPAAGWQTTSILPAPSGLPHNGQNFLQEDAILRGATPDQKVSVYFDNTTDPFGALWVFREDGSRQLVAKGTVRQFYAAGEEFGPWFQGSSDDGRHIVFACRCSLVPGVTDVENDILYEWVDDGSDGGAGTLRVVNLTNAPTPTLIDPAPAELGNAGFEGWGRQYWADANLRNAVSADGSRILFQNPAPSLSSAGSPGVGGPVYLRENGSTTIEVSAPAPGYTPANPPTGFRYLDASHSPSNPSVDGRYVFFFADGDLVSGAAVTGGIYRYDVDTGALDFVDQTTSENNGLASEDGSHFYYQAYGPDGILIKAYIDGVDRVIKSGFIFGGKRGSASTAELFTGVNDAYCPSANVSPDGRYFAFVAGQSGENTRPYLYDSVTDTVKNLAAGASGSYPVSFVSNCGAGIYPLPRKTRVMSDDGQYVFFDTPAALVSQDSNGVWDAYQWHDGEVSLLTPGTALLEAGFLGTDASGENAFILSREPLAHSDIDQAPDIYDVRIDGGFLPPSTPTCAGEACRGATSTPSPSTSAGSASFSGAGNLPGRGSKGRAVKRCKKAAKSKSRCAGKKRKGKGNGKKQSKRTNSNRRASR